MSQLQQTAAHSRHSGETCRRERVTATVAVTRLSGETCRRESSHSYCRQQHTAVTAADLQERDVSQTRLSSCRSLRCDGCVLLSAVAVTRLSPAGLSAAVCCCLL